jgi:hypothetical protein
MQWITSGQCNVGIGSKALFYLSTGNFNTALGAGALFCNTTGVNNTAVGAAALRCSTTGTCNIAVGQNAGVCITTGACNVILGSATANGFGTQNNNIFISDGAGNTRIFVTGSNGFVGVNKTNPAARLDVSGSFAVYSSGSTVVDIQGSQGQLFSVIDALSGSLMSVNDVSGLPILEVFSDDRVVMGTYGAPGLTVSGSLATVATGSSAPAGTAPEGTFKFAVVGGLYYIYAYVGGAWRSGSLS